MDSHKDLRVRRTRKLLKNGLIDLLKEMELEKITVNKLAEKATINRVTFYSHYRDIPDMIEKLVEDMVKQMTLALEREDAATSYTKVAPMWQPLLHLLEYISRHSEFYKVVLSYRGVHLFKQEMSRLLVDRIIVVVGNIEEEGFIQKSGVDKNILIWYNSSVLMGIIISWLENDMPYTPTYLVEQFALIHNKRQ